MRLVVMYYGTYSLTQIVEASCLLETSVDLYQGNAVTSPVDGNGHCVSIDCVQRLCK